MLYHSINDDGRFRLEQDGEMIGLFCTYESMQTFVDGWNEEEHRYEGPIENLINMQDKEKISGGVR